jgi:glycerol-3-phosphate cytidylyltransferase
MTLGELYAVRDKGMKIGITFSTFELLHAGHMAMLADAKRYCHYLIAGLQTDPTIDRPDTKNKPVQSLIERKLQLESVRYVDDIIVYQTENELEEILRIYPIDMRIIGQEYETKEFTGKQICIDRNIQIVYNLPREHNYSSTNLRNRIAAAEAK